MNAGLGVPPELRAEIEAEDAYQARNADKWRTQPSWRWFRRTHEAELVAAGALLKIAGRWFVRAAICDREVLRIGQQGAARAIQGRAQGSLPGLIGKRFEEASGPRK